MDAEDAGVEVVIECEAHLGGAEEGVPLLVGVLRDDRGELALECVAVDAQPLIVVRGQVDGEDVGGHGAPAGDDGGPVVHFLLESGGELDRLDLGLEGLGEGAVDDAVEAVFEAI